MMILDSFLWSTNMTDLSRYWPIVSSTLAFFVAHYPIRQGKVRVFPSQALETFQSPLLAGMNETWRDGAWSGGAEFHTKKHPFSHLNNNILPRQSTAI